MTGQSLRFTADIAVLTVTDTHTGVTYVCTTSLEMAELRRSLEIAHQPEPVVTPRKARRLAQIAERRVAGQ